MPVAMYQFIKEKNQNERRTEAKAGTTKNREVYVSIPEGEGCLPPGLPDVQGAKGEEMTPHWLAVYKDSRGDLSISTGVYATIEEAELSARLADADIEVIRLVTEYPPIMLETPYKEKKHGMD